MPLQSAVSATGRDSGIAAHYGNPYAEQRGLVERGGFVDRSNREIVTVAGGDRWSWLHTLTTQHLEKLGEWRGSQGLILTPTGRVEHHMVFADDSVTTWLDVEPETSRVLVSYLDKMRFMFDVVVADRSADFALVSLLGPNAPDLVAALGAEAPGADWGVEQLGAGWVRRTPLLGDLTQLDVLVPRTDLESTLATLQAAGGVAAGVEAYEALRVAARVPRLGVDTDHRTLVQEVDWVPDAVHLNKGCYRGQETVAKVQNLGKPPRRLVLLHFSESDMDIPLPGAPVEQGGKQVGFLGTAARHYELGLVGLALVKRGTPDGIELTVDGNVAISE